MSAQRFLYTFSWWAYHRSDLAPACGGPWSYFTLNHQNILNKIFIMKLTSSHLLCTSWEQPVWIIVLETERSLLFTIRSFSFFPFSHVHSDSSSCVRLTFSLAEHYNSFPLFLHQSEEIEWLGWPVQRFLIRVWCSHPLSSVSCRGNKLGVLTWMTEACLFLFFMLK